MHVGRVLLLLALSLLAGCSSGGRFRLAEVKQLTVGSSSRVQVEQALGPPDGSLERFSSYRAEASYMTPPTPFAFVSWPLYVSRTYETLQLVARFDERDVLAECSLTLESHFTASVLVLLPVHGQGFEIDAQREATLRTIQAQGIGVRIFGGTPEEPYLSLDAYLGQRR